MTQASASIRYRPARLDDPTEARALAKIDNSIPLAWDPTFVNSKELEDERTQSILALHGNADAYFWLAETPEGKIVGFHWLNVGSRGGVARLAQIFTLWVHEDYRGHGIASELKRAGEKWARERGATAIDTHVHLGNPRMIEINEKNGYERVAVRMRKTL